MLGSVIFSVERLMVCLTVSIQYTNCDMYRRIYGAMDACIAR